MTALLCLKPSSISILFEVGPTRPHMACSSYYLSGSSAISFLNVLEPHCPSCCSSNPVGIFLPQGLFVLSVLFAWMLFLHICVVPSTQSHLLTRPSLTMLSKISASALSLHFMPPFSYLLIHLCISKSNVLSSLSLSLLKRVLQRNRTNEI